MSPKKVQLTPQEVIAGQFRELVKALNDAGYEEFAIRVDRLYTAWNIPQVQK